MKRSDLFRRLDEKVEKGSLINSTSINIYGSELLIIFSYIKKNWISDDKQLLSNPVSANQEGKGLDHSGRELGKIF